MGLESFFTPKMLSKLVDNFLTDDRITPEVEKLLDSYEKNGNGRDSKNVIVIETLDGITYCMICTRSWNLNLKRFEISKPIVQMKFTDVIKLIISNGKN